MKNTDTPSGLLSFDGLIILCKKLDLIGKELVKLVAPSGNFTIYSSYLEVVYKEFHTCISN